MLVYAIDFSATMFIEAETEEEAKKQIENWFWDGIMTNNNLDNFVIHEIEERE